MATTRSLNNAAYSDLELLFIIDEESDADGLTLAQDVAFRLKIRSNGKRTPAGTVSGRFSWMATHKPSCPRGCKRHYGYLQRIDPRSLGLKATDSPRWVITERGRALMVDHLNRVLMREIEKENPGVMLQLMREVSIRGYVGGDFTTASAIRREWLHQAARRRY